MAEYQLYVSDFSPYSMKAAAGLGWAGVDVELVQHTMIDRYTVLKKMTGETMVPVLRKDDWAINDSSDILAWAHEHGERPLLPPRGRRGVCLILEDFFDEWVVRIFGLTRWFDQNAREEVTDKIGAELASGVPVVSGMVGKFAANAVTGVLRNAGLSRDDAPALLASRTRILEATEHLFELGRTMFGGPPTIADFAFYGMFGQMRRDVTGPNVFADYPHTVQALDRLANQKPPSPETELFKLTKEEEADGADRHLNVLHHLFAEFLGTYWRLLVANVRARIEETYPFATVKLIDGTTVRFKPRTYLEERLRMILTEVDAAYRDGYNVFGNEGLRMEAALLENIAKLADTPGGAEIVADYPNIALY